MNTDTLDKILTRVAARRPVFHSEADFQHALALELSRHHHAVRQEVPIQVKIKGQSVGVELDLLATDPESGVTSAIELKYISAPHDVTNGGEPFSLSANWGTNLSRFDALADLERVSAVIMAGKATQGFTILLTNASTAWSRDVMTTSIMARAFSIHEGRQFVAGETLDWFPPIPTVGSVSKKRLFPYAPVQIPKGQICRWRDYSKMKGANGVFRYLMLDAH
jgi:hypothetical protein